MTSESVYCEACGSRLAPDAQFCATCGQEVGVPPAPLPAALAAGPCPKCSSADQTYTAADFVRQDFPKAETNEDEWDPESAKQFLAKPERPELPALFLWCIVPLIPILNALVIWFAPMHKSYKLVMLVLAALFVACVAVPSLYEFGAYAFVGLTILFVYYAGLIQDRGRQKAVLEQTRIPQWNRMLEKWEQIRYCRRCDLAWLAQNPARQVPPEDLKQLFET